MSDTVEMTVDQGLATWRISRRHGNAINGELVSDLFAACRRVEEDPAIRGVLLAASGKLFCPGLDVQELIELDRPAMERFLLDFDRLILEMFTLSRPLVAALHGPAVAGGCILSLTADWRVLREGAIVGLNEVRVGVPFPFGIAMMIRDAVPPSRLEEVALFGRNYRGDEALAAGLVHELHPLEGFESHCRERLEELARKDPRAFATSKRYLRLPAAERMRASGPPETADFLDAWFSPSTQERLQAMIRELRSK